MKLSARNGRWNYDNRTMAGEENEWLEKKQRSFRPFVPVYWLETRSRNESRVALNSKYLIEKEP